jgi:hypothetical protein
MIKKVKGFLLLTALLVGLGYAVARYFQEHKVKAIQEANLAPVVLATSAYAIASDVEVRNILATLQGQYITLDGVVCEYIEANYGYWYLDITSAVQTDTSVLIAHYLDALHLDHNQIMTACDSSMLRTQRLYNFQEASTHLFLSAEILDSAPQVNMEELTYNTPCKYFVSRQKRNIHRLHNFCYDHVELKARVQSIETIGDSIYVSLDCGILTKLEETRWNFAR